MLDRFDDILELPGRGHREQAITIAPLELRIGDDAGRQRHEFGASAGLECREREPEGDVVGGAIAGRDHAPHRRIAQDRGGLRNARGGVERARQRLRHLQHI